MIRHRTSDVSRAGMTIAEVVLALALLCMVMAGAYALIVRSATMMRFSRNRYVAITLGANRLERAANLDYNTLYLIAEDKLVVDDNGAGSLYGGFRRTTTVDPNYVMTVGEGTNAVIVTNTYVKVVIEVRDIQSGQFEGFYEEVATIFVEYLEP